MTQDPCLPSGTQTCNAASGARTLRRRIAGGFLLVLLIFAAYLPAVRGEFIGADIDAVARDPRLVNIDGLRRIWFSLEADQYQPLTQTSYWIERRIWGVRPWGYHLVNVMLHALNALLVWRLLSKIGVRGAGVAAAVFALHPVNVESVAWIFERKNVLSALFYFLTFAALFRFDEGGGRRWYGISLLLFVAALLAKTSTVVLPAVLLLYWWWRRTSRRWRDVAASLPFFLMAGAMAALTVWYEHHYTGASGVEYSSGFAERFARAGWIVLFYLGKCFLPLNLAFYYPRWSVDPSAVASYLPHAAISLFFIVLVVQHRAWARTVLFGLGSYLITLFPILGFFDIYYHKISFVADHFQYLALVGLIALCVHVVVCGLDRLGLIGNRPMGGKVKFVGYGLSVLVVATCWTLSWQRAHLFRDMRALCEDTLQQHPDSWVAHLKLGEHLLREQDDDRAELELALQHFQRALELKPGDGHVLSAVAMALTRLQRDDEAMAFLRRAVAAKPDHARFHLALAQALLQRDDRAGAIAEYEESIRCKPKFWASRFMLGRVLIDSGQIEEGLGRLREAVDLRPDLPGPRIALGTALCKAGRFDEGVAQLREVLRRHPRHSQAAAMLKKMEMERRQGLDPSAPLSKPAP